MLGHLGRSGGAVQPEDVDPQGIDGGEGGADLSPGQHPSGRLDRDLRLYRDLATRLLHGPPGSVDGRFQPQKIELGLDDEEVDPALEQGCRLVRVRVPEVGVPDLAECREPGPRSDRSGNPPGPIARRELVGHLPGESGGGEIQLMNAILDAVLAEGDGEAAEAVGFYDVDAGVEERGVDVLDESGSGDIEDLIASVEVRSAEVVFGESRLLQRRTHGAVVDDDTRSGGFDICIHGFASRGGSHVSAPGTHRPDGAPLAWTAR